jgi:hypothetical protein
MKLTDHLKEAADYMNSRINAVDNKASIIIAVEAGLFGITTFVIEKLYLPYNDLKIISYISLGIIGLFTAIVIGFLLQVIRPTKCFFGIDSGMPRLDSSEIYWPNMNSQPEPSDLSVKFDKWSPYKYETDLRAAVFACQFLIYKKYGFYRKALLFAKIQLVVAVGLLLLIPLWLIVKWAGSSFLACFGMV